MLYRTRRLLFFNKNRLSPILVDYLGFQALLKLKWPDQGYDLIISIESANGKPQFILLDSPDERRFRFHVELLNQTT